MKSHKYDKKNETALTHHILKTKYTFNFEIIKILNTESYEKRRKKEKKNQKKADQNCKLKN